MNSSVKMLNYIKNLFKGRMKDDNKPTAQELTLEYQNAALALVARMRGVSQANREIQQLAQRLNELDILIKAATDGKDTSSKEE